ncbi:MAG: YggS family pyridoxal phosphate-dependent enzyme [Verrucomicrobiae bacterium]|nr:YggS family pyridoxal phosphate-dependent enzyme [Verrucomicrobiae bacterium]NNJ85539.1 YggS family pyridoxal phosphate-dependent enzyme [Akkermansiaceae bacterium]
MGEAIAANLAEVKDRVANAALRSGRAADAAELLVVSKTWPTEKVAEVVDAGHTSFGENRVQEAESKVPTLPDHLHWHLIGHLQRNKVRKALPLFQTIHSIDSLKLARYTSNIAGELGVNPDVYLQVDLAGEETKNGYQPDVLRLEIAELLALENLSIKGLMCIPPIAATPEDARPWFVQLREFRDDLQNETGHSLPGLSMGMSGDYEVAIEEGSTIVRVGSAIFGPRSYG